jgi:hypothetical protein
VQPACQQPWVSAEVLYVCLVCSFECVVVRGGGVYFCSSGVFRRVFGCLLWGVSGWVVKLSGVVRGGLIFDTDA